MRKSNSRKTILKEAGVLLIAAILILTTLFVLTPMTKMAKAQTSLLNENFESLWGPYGDNPPAGWTITTNEPAPITWDTNNWYKYNYGGAQGNVARIYYSPVRSQDDSLITPTIDCRTYTQVTLKFWNYFYYYSSATHAYIWGSTDGGSNWDHLIASYTSSIYASPMEYDISGWAMNQQYVKIRFQYIDYDGLYWMIDNVQVIGDVVNNPPYEPSNPDPANDVTGVSPCLTSCLSWVGGDPDGDPVTYEIWYDYGTGTLTQVDTGLTVPQWCPPDGFQSGLTYHWKIVAHDNHGYSTDGPTWSFTTPTIKLQINQVYVQKNDVKVDITNTGSSTISDIYVEMKFTVNPTSPCSCYPTPTLTGKGLTQTSPNVYIKTFPLFKLNGGKSTTLLLSLNGCACFELTITASNCISTGGGVVQQTKQGCICDLTLC
jgi:hypothetical protein